LPIDLLCYLYSKLPEIEIPCYINNISYDKKTSYIHLTITFPSIIILGMHNILSKKRLENKQKERKRQIHHKRMLKLEVIEENLTFKYQEIRKNITLLFLEYGFNAFGIAEESIQNEALSGDTNYLYKIIRISKKKLKPKRNIFEYNMKNGIGDPELDVMNVIQWEMPIELAIKTIGKIDKVYKIQVEKNKIQKMISAYKRQKIY